MDSSCANLFETAITFPWSRVEHSYDAERRSVVGCRHCGVAFIDVELHVKHEEKCPDRQTQPAPASNLPIGSRDPPPGRVGGKRLANLLLVDDDGDLVEALADHLRSEGHEVRTASDGEEGLKALRTLPLPDALVLNVDMPILGGPGMARRMLLHNAGQELIPILLVSSRDDLPQIAKAMGTSYFLRKPCDLTTFLALLDRALDERRPPASA